MTTTDQQREERKGQVRRGEARNERVGLGTGSMRRERERKATTDRQMINRQERQGVASGKLLSQADANAQAGTEAWSGSHRDGCQMLGRMIKQG